MKILGRGLYDGGDLDFLRERAEFRRATLNQLIACQAVTQALQGHEAKTSKMGFIVATRHGELEVTKDFLGELGRSGVARPILFQNSLHNATLGFLTKVFQITGPSLTVSNSTNPGESATQMASVLLDSGEIDYCLVVEVDVKVPQLQPTSSSASALLFGHG